MQEFSGLKLIEMVEDVERLTKHTETLADRYSEEYARLAAEPKIAIQLSMVYKAFNHKTFAVELKNKYPEYGPDNEKTEEILAGIVLANMLELVRLGYEAGKRTGVLEDLYGRVGKEDET